MSLLTLKVINTKRLEIVKNKQTINGELEAAEQELDSVKFKIENINKNLVSKTEEESQLIEGMVMLAKLTLDLSQHYQECFDALKLQDGDFLNFISSKAELPQEFEQKLIQQREEFKGQPKLYRKAWALTLKESDTDLLFLLEKEEDQNNQELLFIVSLLEGRVFEIAKS